MSLSRETRMMITTSSLIFLLGFATLLLGGIGGKLDSNFATWLGVAIIFVMTGVNLFFEVEDRSSTSKVEVVE